MGRSKRLIEAQKERIMEEFDNWIGDCPYIDADSVVNHERLEELSWGIAQDNYESAMEDRADMLRDEARGL